MHNVFSFYLSKGSGSEGNLKFGGYDLKSFAKKDATDNDIIWNNVIDDGWTISLNGLKFYNGSKV
jgi:hypothetical protein